MKLYSVMQNKNELEDDEEKLLLGHVGQRNIWLNFRARSWESPGSKVTKDTFNETMGEQYSYRETFALWAGNTVNKAEWEWPFLSI